MCHTDAAELRQTSPQALAGAVLRLLADREQELLLRSIFGPLAAASLVTKCGAASWHRFCRQLAMQAVAFAVKSVLSSTRARASVTILARYVLSQECSTPGLSHYGGAGGAWAVFDKRCPPSSG